MPNYTGSIGFGEKYVLKLLGEAGLLDVEDCIASVRHLVKVGLVSEASRQYLTGGSHGGFIIGNRTSFPPLPLTLHLHSLIPP